MPNARSPHTPKASCSTAARTSTLTGFTAIVMCWPAHRDTGGALRLRRVDAHGELHQPADPCLLCVAVVGRPRQPRHHSFRGEGGRTARRNQLTTNDIPQPPTPPAHHRQAIRLTTRPPGQHSAPQRADPLHDAGRVGGRSPDARVFDPQTSAPRPTRIPATTAAQNHSSATARASDSPTAHPCPRSGPGHASSASVNADPLVNAQVRAPIR